MGQVQVIRRHRLFPNNDVAMKMFKHELGKKVDKYGAVRVNPTANGDEAWVTAYDDEDMAYFFFPRLYPIEVDGLFLVTPYAVAKPRYGEGRPR